MYHPTRGGVRGGRDQFNWDDVKADKHRENYLGHSIKAPVGRWQKGKDLHWYTRDKSSKQMDAVKEEIKLIKEKEEQAMREALGLAPQRSSRSYGNRLDKREFSELVQRGSTAEDLGDGHAEAARVQGLGFSRVGAGHEEEEEGRFSEDNVKSSITCCESEKVDAGVMKDDSSGRKRRGDEEKRHEKRHDRDSDAKTTHRRRKHE